VGDPKTFTLAISHVRSRWWAAPPAALELEEGKCGAIG
jgi:hypothetical protein